MGSSSQNSLSPDLRKQTRVQIHPVPTTVFTFLFSILQAQATPRLWSIFLPPSGDLSPVELDTENKSWSGLREALSPSTGVWGGIPKDKEGF